MQQSFCHSLIYHNVDLSFIKTILHQPNYKAEPQVTSSKIGKKRIEKITRN